MGDFSAFTALSYDCGSILVCNLKNGIDNYALSPFLSGDNPLTRDPFPPKRDSRMIHLLHSRRISSPKGLCDHFLAML
jgi:hypothetical protein